MTARNAAIDRLERNLLAALPSVAGLRPAPRRGACAASERHCDCELASACVGLAARLGWDALDCGACPVRAVPVPRADIEALAWMRRTGELEPEALGVEASEWERRREQRVQWARRRVLLLRGERDAAREQRARERRRVRRAATRGVA
jgi:hypothetical protein